LDHKVLKMDIGVIRMEQSPIMLFCDNSGAVTQFKEPKHHKRGKHTEYKYHLIREIVSHRDVVVAKNALVENLIEIFY
jgi:alpha-L-fucosidase